MYTRGIKQVHKIKYVKYDEVNQQRSKRKYTNFEEVTGHVPIFHTLQKECWTFIKAESGLRIQRPQVL